VGRFVSGSKGNIIPDKAELSITTRAYDEKVRARLKESIIRMIDAECVAAGGARAEYRFVTSAPVTFNDPEATARVRAAFDEHFGEDSIDENPVAASEDFGTIPLALDAPYVYWFFGGFDADPAPSNHSPDFIPEMQPTLETGVKALVVAAMVWLGQTSPQ